MIARRASAALLLSAVVLLALSCRSAGSSGAAAATGCDNEVLTAYPALLVLAPHPDDEALGFTGLIDAYSRAGKPVSVVVVTDGDAYCEACRFWKSSTVAGPMCTAEELSNFATRKSTASPRSGGPRAPPRRGFSVFRLHVFSATPTPAWPPPGAISGRGQTGRAAPPVRLLRLHIVRDVRLRRRTADTLTADTLLASLREVIAAVPDGALIATTPGSMDIPIMQRWAISCAA